MYGVIAVMLAIAIFHVPDLYKNNNYRQLAAFLVFWIISGVYAIVVVRDISLISPFDLIISISKQFYKYLGY